MAEPVIILCPCCASPLDTEDDPENEQHYECVPCGQQWSMVVERDRLAAHSLT